MHNEGILGSWQHRVSPGVVPVIVSGYGRVPSDQGEFPSGYDVIMSGYGRFVDESNEEFDTPIVVIHEDVGGES